MAKSLKPPGKAKAKPAGKTKKEAAAKPAAAKKGAAANGNSAPKSDKEKGQEVLANSFDALHSQLKTVRQNKTELDDAQVIVRKKSGTYRSAIKTAVQIGKAIGLTSDDVTWLMLSIDRDPEEIDRETSRRNRIAKLWGLPIGSQLGLFEDEDGGLTSVADAAEKAQAAKANGNGKQSDDAGFDTPEALEAAGYKSFGAKMEEADCPYPEGHGHREHWLKGHRKAAEHAATLTAKRTLPPPATHAGGNA